MDSSEDSTKTARPKAGDVITLTKEELDGVKEYSEIILSSRGAMRYFSQLDHQANQRLWAHIRSLHPELVGVFGSYDHDTGKITVISADES